VLLLCSGLAATVHAQNASPVSRIPLTADSGRIANTRSGASRSVWSTTVFAPRAAWMRVQFRRVELSGNPETDLGSYLLITSLADGASQRLDARTIRQWGNATALFNGDAVRIDLCAAPGTGESRVVLDSALAGSTIGGGDSICGPTDDRVLSTDGRIARVVNPGGGICTAFVISDSARCMLSAGSCAVSGASIIEFNVPLSSASGAIAHPPPQDQYVVDPSSIQSQSAGPGSNWAYFGVLPNANTGMGAAPAEANGVAFAAAPPAAGQNLRLTGFGTTIAPVLLTWSQAQKTGAGPYVSLIGSLLRHQIDATAGDAGAPIRLDATGQAIAINDGDGCADPVAGTSNTATALQNAALQAALASPAGVCAHAGGPPEPPLYLGVDPSGNLLTVSRVNASSGTVGNTGIPGPVDGLAYDRGRRLFYASEHISGGPDRLYRIDRSSGAATLIGTIVGAQDASGLAFDPDTDTLWGIDQGSGQMYTIDLTTAAATPVGVYLNPNVGGIDFDPASRTLYGLEDHPTLGTRLIKLDLATMQPTVIGVLGTGITDCDGLAYCTDDGYLYTVDQGTHTAYRIAPSSGLATAIGPAGTSAGSGYGMACGVDCAPPCPPNSPTPADGQFEFPITGNLAWIGCPNQKVFGVDSNPNLAINVLYDIVTGTGGVTAIGNTSPETQITGLTWAAGAMYALDLTTGDLVILDTLTGHPTLVGNTGISGWQELAADATDLWTLYGITQTNHLYRISWTGAITPVTNAQVGNLITAMSFDRFGQLWGIEFGTGRILRIDKRTGAIALSATTISGFQGLDFDDAGTAYAHNSNTDSLYTLNLQTGVATLRGGGGTNSVTCLAFGRSTNVAAPPPPPPYKPTGPRPHDPTNFTRGMVLPPPDPSKIIDGTHHGLPEGSVAVLGEVYPAGIAPPPPLAMPIAPGVTDGATDVPCGGTLINFDAAPAPCGFGLATRLSYQFADKGVVFEGPGGTDGGAILNSCSSFGITGFSGSNFVAFNPASTLADGGVPRGPETLRFTSPVSSVLLLAGGPTPALLTMQAFRGGTLVASTSATLSTAMAPLAVLGGGITRVVLTSAAPFAIDNLCFVQSCPTTYDVYFGTTNPPPLRASAVVGTNFDPGSLTSTTLYYWRLVAHNCCGQTTGPVWRVTTVCYPNCDASTVPPILNVNDFVCFLTRYTNGDTYANCDDSTIPPLLTVNDFVCFQAKFIAGCPQ
jgi:hypothetical protein